MLEKYKFKVTFLIAKTLEVETYDEIQAEKEAGRLLRKKDQDAALKIKVECVHPDYQVNTDFYSLDEEIKSWWK